MIDTKTAIISALDKFFFTGISQKIDSIIIKDDIATIIIKSHNPDILKAIPSMEQYIISNFNINACKIIMHDSKNIAEQKIQIANVKSVIAICSGKGGVGKSTSTVNLALAAASLSLKVGIVDIDIYGPSIAHMLSTGPIEAKQTITPQFTSGIYSVSIANLTNSDDALIWRGPMAGKAMHQMLCNTNWPNLDILFIDMPPGTGDIALNLFKKYRIDGAILVSTAHKLALIDVSKAKNMLDKLDIKNLGVIENMAMERDQQYSALVQQYCEQENLAFLARIPYSFNISDSADGKLLQLDNENLELYKQAIFKIIN